MSGERKPLAWGNLGPGRLWSLWEMLKFNGPKFYYVTTLLAGLVTSLSQIRWDRANPGTIPNEPKLNMAPLTPDFDALAEHFKDLGMDDCHIALVRVKNLMTSYSKGEQHATLELVENQINEFRTRVHDALKKPSFLVLNGRERELFEAKEPLFGKTVEAAFADIRDDLEEAGKCFALDRNTAMVFHLMRVMESVVRKLGATVPVTVVNANGEFCPWMTIVSNLKDKIPSLPVADQDKWIEVHNLLWGVGKAWRNKTMHPDKSYTDEQARAVWDAVKNFLTHLAPLV